MSTLYEIDRAILECVDGESGEIIDIDRLQALQLERDEKVEKVALWYKNLLSDAEQYKAEKNAFADKEKAAKNKAESLKSYLDSALAGNTYKSTRVNISYRSSTSVVIDDINAIDDKYKTYEPSVNKTDLKKAINAGEEISGAHIEINNNIQIK